MIKDTNFTNRENALITGASSGIGYELSKLFAENNYNLILVARNRKTLNEIAEELRGNYGVNVKVIAKDLSKRTAPLEIFKDVIDESADIDVLVNNAGFGIYGLFSDIDINKQIEMLEVNIISLTSLTWLFLKGMVERKKGKILNVASVAGFVPAPFMGVNHASKSYILSFSEALSNELNDSGVTVTALCPGPTNTEFLNKANMRKLNLHRFNMMNPEAVAEAGFKGLKNNKRVIIPGALNKISAHSPKFIPKALLIELTNFFMRKTA